MSVPSYDKGDRVRARTSILGATHQANAGVRIAEADDPGIVEHVEGSIDGDLFVHWPRTDRTVWVARFMVKPEEE